MNVGVASTHNDAIVPKEQLKSFKPESRCFHYEEQPEQYRSVGDHHRSNPTTLIVEDYLAMSPVNPAGAQSAQYKY